MAKKNKSTLDFVPTISDSEDVLMGSESSDDGGDELNNIPAGHGASEKNRQGKNRNNKVKKDIDDAHRNGYLNPDFTFDVEDNDIVSELQTWDFLGDEPIDENVKKDVDLDRIIRRKGGLLKHLRVENDVDKVEQSEGQGSGSSEDDEDELAMDGFGMGAIHRKEMENNGDVEDQENDENDSHDGESEDARNQKDEDSPEDVAAFYAPEDENEVAKRKIFDTFDSLSLSRPILKALNNLGYTIPSPIQGATIPIALLGKDIIAGAVTGSGKTAAFMIPIIERLIYRPAKIARTRVVVLTPTRELAIQVAGVGKKIGKYVDGLTFGLAVGGLNLRQQEQILKTRPDIVVATPGRFIDHIRNSSSFNVDFVEILVIDEADRMLEEGFQDELNEIMHLLPNQRQTMLFSATMNSKIKQLVSLSLKRPVRVMIDPPKQAASRLKQEFLRIRKRDHLKPSTLFYLIRKLDNAAEKRMLIFVSKKEMVHRLRIILGLLGVPVAELHGSLNQEQRLQSIAKFKSLEVSVLICTDLASRGLDIPKIEFVVNYDMPKTYEIYLHRIGRTARAGREGCSVSFVGETSQERNIVKSAIKSAQESGDKNLPTGRTVDWSRIEEISKTVDSMSGTIEEILDEEKEEKEILWTEMQLKRSENMIKHKDEIGSRPKRTWFQSPSEKKNSEIMASLSKKKVIVSSKKRKKQEAIEGSIRLYKKTGKNRSEDQEKSFKGRNGRKLKDKKKSKKIKP